MFGAVSTAKETFPIPLMSVAILLPALVLIVGAWSTLNWYLSLAPLFPEPGLERLGHRWMEICAVKPRPAAGSVDHNRHSPCRDCFVVALLLCLAVSAVITNPRVSIADLVAISLLIF